MCECGGGDCSEGMESQGALQQKRIWRVRTLEEHDDWTLEW